MIAKDTFYLEKKQTCGLKPFRFFGGKYVTLSSKISFKE